MIGFIALGVLILFVVFLAITFLSYTSLFLNLIIIIILYFLIRKDLKDRTNHKYYIFSLLLTAIFFIFSASGLIKDFLVLTEKMLLSTPIIAVILIYVFAHLIAYIHELYHYLKEKYKR